MTTNETITLHYDFKDGESGFSTSSKCTTTDALFLPEVLSKFKDFLNAAGWHVASIDAFSPENEKGVSLVYSSLDWENPKAEKDYENV